MVDFGKFGGITTGGGGITTARPRRSRPKGPSTRKLLERIEVLEARLAELEASKPSEIPLSLIEGFARKYAGTKKRWGRPGCSEPDFLAYKELMRWVEKTRKSRG